MLWPMILLAVNAAIFDEATGALLQFYVVNFRFAARCTAHQARSDRRFFCF
jgi:hypothetical protein